MHFWFFSKQELNISILWIPWITYKDNKENTVKKKKKKWNNIFQLYWLCFAIIQLESSEQSHFHSRRLGNKSPLILSRKDVENVAVSVTLRHSFYMCIKQVCTERDAFIVLWKFCHRPVWHWFLPGRGREQKLEVSAWRSVSRCWWRRPFRPLSCITSPSSRSTAARMLSTCFCRAALRSSYSMWVFRSCRISASRAVRSKKYAEKLTVTEQRRGQRAQWAVPLFFFICSAIPFTFLGNTDD